MLKYHILLRVIHKIIIINEAQMNFYSTKKCKFKIFFIEKSGYTYQLY